MACDIQEYRYFLFPAAQIVGVSCVQDFFKFNPLRVNYDKKIELLKKDHEFL